MSLGPIGTFHSSSWSTLSQGLLFSFKQESDFLWRWLAGTRCRGSTSLSDDAARTSRARSGPRVGTLDPDSLLPPAATRASVRRHGLPGVVASGAEGRDASDAVAGKMVATCLRSTSSGPSRTLLSWWSCPTERSNLHRPLPRSDPLDICSARCYLHQQSGTNTVNHFLTVVRDWRG